MKIIVTLSTIPCRFELINIVIENLSQQTLKPDKIILYIPKRYIRFNTDYVIPESLLKCKDKIPYFEIKMIDNDYGPATKLLPALLDYTCDDDIIISVDDDVLLENHAFEELINLNKRFPNSVLGFMGINDNKFIHSEYLDNIEMYPVNGILGGYRSILYPRHIFKDDFLNHYNKILELHNNNQLSMINSDDHLWYGYSQFKNIISYVIGTKYPNKSNTNGWNFKLLDFGNGISNDSNTYKSCEIIMKYFNSIKNGESKI